MLLMSLDLNWRFIHPSFTSVVECNRYYSMYKHVEKLAQEIRKGAAPGDGVNAKLWQVSQCSLYSVFYETFLTILGYNETQKLTMKSLKQNRS